LEDEAVGGGADEEEAKEAAVDALADAFGIDFMLFSLIFMIFMIFMIFYAFYSRHELL
jgi:hypothetical protein